MNSKIQLLKADGSLLLELAWGETIVEPAAGDKPEATVLPVRTNRTKDAVGIAEGSITALNLEKL
ncbi:MAG: hypothetical protein EOP05_12520 [Proteobacteria bacterium]|nr:MAG: hypothetical protein EOP05_12520 [Pseudomonadota bacterium]